MDYCVRIQTVDQNEIQHIQERNVEHMKTNRIIRRIAACTAAAAVTLLFTGCTKYKLVPVESSAASTAASTAAAASVSVSGNGTASLPTSDIKEETAKASSESTTVSGNSVSADSTSAEGKLQIVVMGDSIFDNYRTPSGIAALVGQQLNANVYNMAVAGTTAALPANCPNSYDKWNDCDFIGIAHVLTGDIKPELLDGHAAKDVYGTFDTAKTDYFIIEYGINDFLSSIPRETNMAAQDLDLYSYRGALKNGIMALQGKFPNAQIIIMAPGYTQFWNNGKMIGDCNTIDRGYGRLVDYTATAVNIAQQMNVSYINSYEDVDINGYSASDCLEDGIHPTDEGCRRYAKTIVAKIQALETAKNGTAATTAASAKSGK